MDLLAELTKDDADDGLHAVALRGIRIDEISGVAGPANLLDGWVQLGDCRIWKSAEARLADLLAAPSSDVVERWNGWTVTANSERSHVDVATPSGNRFLVPIGLAESNPGVVVATIAGAESSVGKSVTPRTYRLSEPAAPKTTRLDKAFDHLAEALKEHHSRRQVRSKDGRFERGAFRGSYFRDSTPTRVERAGFSFFR